MGDGNAAAKAASARAANANSPGVAFRTPSTQSARAASGIPLNTEMTIRARAQPAHIVRIAVLHCERQQQQPAQIRPGRPEV
ncbi:hypothetical protein NSPZN2_60030 [Nitrospira defluvii]|uniref:Uncharacterized protein n=1 Tax=Nitrospira defluvii TaxID=330214 RepID=A0ABM8S6B2_9BACT|nr:hypothetical protein NSPZN2_60030 [Nitrospira defluvii]